MQACHYEAEQVAAWQATEVIKGIESCFREQPASDDESEPVGDSKLRRPADATTEAFDSGEAADDLPFVSYQKRRWKAAVTLWR